MVKIDINKVNRIDAYFQKNGYPLFDVQLMQGVVVPAKRSYTFVTSHISVLSVNSDKRAFIPCYNRLCSYAEKVHAEEQKTHNPNYYIALQKK